MKKAYLRAPSLPAGAVKGFAHRGCDTERENTMAAFRAMVDLGYRYLETDVHTTRDGIVVCFHDQTLDRVSTGKGPIGDHTWAELQQLQVGGEPIITFEELLKEFPDHHVNVDLKDNLSSKLIGAVMARNNALERVLISSFLDQHRQDFYDTNPEYRSVVASSAGQRTLAALWAASRIGNNPLSLQFGRWLRKRKVVDAAQIPIFHDRRRVCDKKFVRFCQAIGLEVHVWTINDTETMEELFELGVDGIMTDDGPALAELLDRRGHWPQ